MCRFLLAALMACGGSETVPEAAAPEPVTAKPPRVAPAPPAQPAADGEAETAVDIGRFAELKAAGNVPLLVDVRTAAEWKTGHVPGAVHIPMAEIQGRVGELEAHKDGPIYFICASGGRSGRVSELLQKEGYQAVNVLGGTSGWTAAGHPLE